MAGHSRGHAIFNGLALEVNGNFVNSLVGKVLQLLRKCGAQVWACKVRRRDEKKARFAGSGLLQFSQRYQVPTSLGEYAGKYSTLPVR